MDDEFDSTYADRVHDTAAGYIADGMSEEEAYERAQQEEPARVD